MNNFLVAIVVFLIPTYLIRFSLFGIPTNFFEIAVGLVFLYGLANKDVRKSWRASWQQLPRQIFLWLFLFLVAAIISNYISAESRVSLGILKSWIIIPVILGWLVYAKSVVSSQWLVVEAITASGLVTALLSLSQFVPGERLAGIYDVPNSLALWLVPIIVLASARTRSMEYGVRNKGLNYGAIAVMSFTLLLTQSVAGIGVAILMIGLLIFTSQKVSLSKRYWLYFLGIVLAASLFLWGSGRIQYFMQPSNSLAARQQLWSVSSDLIKENPIFGVGLGQFEPAYQSVLHERFASCQLSDVSCTRPLAEWVFRDPHNWLLSFWLNMGLLGLVSFSALNVVALFLSPISKSLPIKLALLSLLVFGLVDTIFWKNDLSALYFVLLALLASQNSRVDGVQNNESE